MLASFGVTLQSWRALTDSQKSPILPKKVNEAHLEFGTPGEKKRIFHTPLSDQSLAEEHLYHFGISIAISSTA